MQCHLSAMSDSPGRVSDTLPKKGKVTQVCKKWLVHEDSALAYALQQQEVEKHYHGNKQRNAVVREDFPLALTEQRKEEEAAMIRYKQRIRDMQAHDEMVARQLALKLEAEEREERMKKQDIDHSIAIQMQAKEEKRIGDFNTVGLPLPIATQQAQTANRDIRQEEEDEEVAPALPPRKSSPQKLVMKQLEGTTSHLPTNNGWISEETGRISRTSCSSKDEVSIHRISRPGSVDIDRIPITHTVELNQSNHLHISSPINLRMSPVGKSSGITSNPSIDMVKPPIIVNNPMEDLIQEADDLDKAGPSSRVESWPPPPSTPELDRHMQELRDEEVARRLQEELETEVEMMERDHLLAMEAQDKEIAKMLQDKERAKVRRAKVRAKAKALEKKQEATETKSKDKLDEDITNLTSEIDEITVSTPNHQVVLTPRHSPLGICNNDENSDNCSPGSSVLNSVAGPVPNIAAAIDPTFSLQRPSSMQSPRPRPTVHDPMEDDGLPYFPVQGQKRTSSLDKKKKKDKNKDPSCKQQ